MWLFKTPHLMNMLFRYANVLYIYILLKFINTSVHVMLNTSHI